MSSRPVRGSALRANQVWAAAENGTGHYSSGEDDREGPAKPVQQVAKRGLRVELSRLEVPALIKYRKHFRLGDAAPSCTKDDLMPGVLRHFSNMVVEEEVVLSHFVTSIQRHAKARSQQLAAAGGVHKRGGHK